MDRQQEAEKIEKECLAYFRQHPIWKKILKGFREKYSSYGRFGGKVVLKGLKAQDIEELEGFFGRSFHGQKSVTVSAEKFRQALEASRYKDMTPEALLESFLRNPFLENRSKKFCGSRKKNEYGTGFVEAMRGRR